MITNSSHQLPSQVTNVIIPRFKSERVRVPDQYDPDTGLPLYRTVETVQLLIPGDKGNSPVKKVNDEIRNRFRKEYEHWKTSGKTGDFEGTGLPLAQWPQLPKEVAAGLNHANVYTVEQLAGLTDAQCQIRGTLGLRKYRDMAAAYVDSSRAAAPIAKLAGENEALERRINLLEAQLKSINELATKQAEALQRLGDATPALNVPPLDLNSLPDFDKDSE